jgi:hypothetical protein
LDNRPHFPVVDLDKWVEAAKILNLFSGEVQLLDLCLCIGRRTEVEPPILRRTSSSFHGPCKRDSGKEICIRLPIHEPIQKEYFQDLQGIGVSPVKMHKEGELLKVVPLPLSIPYEATERASDF